MKKNYIAPQMVETEITLRSCICSGGVTDGVSIGDNVNGTGGDAPMRKINGLYI